VGDGQGERYGWGTIVGPVTVWHLLGAGLAVFAVFLEWQARRRREPLVPLGLFRDRNFSVATLGISTVSFSVTAMAFPFMLWTQVALGLDATHAGLLFVPMAVVTAALAPFVGRLTDERHPRLLTSIGFVTSSAALFATCAVMGPATPIWQLLALNALLGLGNAFLWSPLASTATRNLPMNAAGAGSGVYNTTRQVGAVLGSAAIAAAISARLTERLAFGGGVEDFTTTSLPPEAAEPFSRAMAEALLVPAGAFLVGLVVVQAFVRPTHMRRPDEETVSR